MAFLTKFAIVMACGALAPSGVDAQTMRRGIDSMKDRAERQSGTAEAAAEGFRVESFTPQGRALLDDSVTVEFTAPLADGLKAPELAALVAFDPSVECDATLEAPNKVRLSPRRPFRPGTLYKVQVSPLARDNSGRPLSGTAKFEFHTGALELMSFGQVSFGSDRSASIQLNFNQPVAPSELRKHLRALHGTTAVPFDIAPVQASSSPRLTFKNIPAKAAAISVKLQKGLRGTVGNRPLEQSIDRSVPVQFSVRAPEVTAEWRGADPVILLESNTPLDVDAAQSIKISPAVDFTAESEGYKLALRGKFRAGQRYKVAMAAGLKTAEGHELREAAEATVYIGPQPAFVSLQDAGGYLSLQGRMKLRLRHFGFPAVRLRVWRLYDSNVPHYVAGSNDDYEFAGLSQRIASSEITLPEADEAAITEVDITELLGEAKAGYYRFEAQGLNAGGSTGGEDYDYSLGRRRGRDTARIALTNLAAVAKVGPRSMGVWVAGLSDAKPVAGARVEVFSKKFQPVGQGQTDSRGMAMIENPAFQKDQKPGVVVVSHGHDRTFLDLDRIVPLRDELDALAGRPYLAGGFEAFVTAERGAYRPGEAVRLFGLVRDRAGNAPGKALPLQLRLTTPDGRRLPASLLTIDASTGAFETTVPTSRSAPTGLWRASLRLPYDQHKAWIEGRGQDEEDSHDGEDGEDGTLDTGEDVRPEDLQASLRLGNEEIGAADFFVEDFVPNRLKVSLSAKEGRLSAASPLEVGVLAEEMFGASAGSRPFEGRAIFTPLDFTSPSFPGYVFGNSERKFTRQETRVEEAELSDQGRASAAISLPPGQPPAALRATILMTVKDIGGRGVSSRIERTIDPVPFYLGMLPPQRGFLPIGEKASIAIAAARPDGQPLSGETREVSATVYRVRWNSLLKSEDGRFSYEVTRDLAPVESTTVELSGGRGALEFTPRDAGSYLVIADATGVAGPGVPSVALNLYASRGQWQDEAWSMERPERVEVVADKVRYAPGDKAKILVKAPFRGTLLLTVEQDGVLHHEVREMGSNTEEVELALDERHLPDAHVVATVLRPVRPAGRWLPHRAAGATRLAMDAESRRLSITPEAPDEARPGSRAKVALSVADSSTSAAAAGVSVTLWAVDEGILSLTNFQTPDPHGFFYGPRRHGMRQSDFLGQLMPDIDPAKAQAAPGGGEAGRRGFVSPVASDRVKPVSLWLGTQVTGPDGKVVADIEIPQFIGRLRIMAMASQQARFGGAAVELPIRGPVMVREGLPRFASPGDQLFVPFTAYNNTDEFASMTVTVATTGPAKPVSVGRWLEQGPSTIRIETTATARQSSTRLAEIQIPRETGTATFQIRAQLGGESFSESVEVPVRPAVPLVRRSGVLEVAAGQTASIPATGEFLPGTARLHISAGSLPMLAFAPALLELSREPFGCSEQIAAVALPLLHLPDLAKAVDPDRYDSAGRTRKVQEAIDRLCLMQTSDGGFSMWPGQMDSAPFNSMFVTHFLLEAKDAGFEVPGEAMRAALDQARDLLTAELDGFSPEAQGVVRAYAAYIQTIAGQPDRSALESLVDKLPKAGNEARAIVAAAFAAARAPSRARELLAGQATFLSERDAGGAYSSPVRETALLLAAWLRVDAKSPEVARLAARLSKLANQRGHFGTTQDNAFALFALGKLASATASDRPANGSIAMHGFAPMEFEQGKPVSLVSDSVPPTTPTVTVESGGGPAFVFYSVEGVPPVLRPEETTITQGLSVGRRFFDRAGRPVVPRRLEQGQLLQVEIEIGPSRRIPNVAIVDLLPAGFEVENPNLVSAADSSDGGENGALTIQRTEVRDDRFVAFVDLEESASPRKLRYSVRCVTAGTFALGPVQAVAMYDPDIVARGGAGVVSINPRRNVTPAPLP